VIPRAAARRTCRPARSSRSAAARFTRSRRWA
jgi:hypothetical protein